ncbi:bifunctional DNA primase/polymerase [Agrococcus sp. KRD186]|uniref:bifunctional DNA primase/polymerase n=1 Tax=Agrococcus sp. KRD186 TaxID=2729730 RepID=UPI0019D2496B|nr:bifunctional DNA primase/polymerase [Agrococcus sp. KRD186]
MPTTHDALALAAAGWQLLPLRGKVPLTAHGVRDASADPEQVRAWWPAGALHNLGARVPGGLVVLDLDPRNGGTLDTLAGAAGDELPATLTVLSGRGDGGRHLYFQHPGGRLTSTRLPEGIDVKTSTGYCVMPPSLHPATGQPYRWLGDAGPARLPHTLAQLLRVPSLPRPAAPLRADAGLDAKAAHLVEYVGRLPEGKRNAGLYWAACRAHDEGQPAGTFDALERAALSIGLPAAEARATIASARRGGAA